MKDYFKENNTISLPLIFENNQVWIFNKPAGLAVQGGKGINVCVESYLNDLLETKIYLVHRLDKETNGILLVAKNSQAAAKYSKYFEHHDVIKKYFAYVLGTPPKILSIHDEIKMHGKFLKPAETQLQLIKSHQNFSLISLLIHTGRMHQIRIHLKNTGYPIIGDQKYGNFSTNRTISKDFGLNQLMLCAKSLSIPKEKINIEIAYPDYFHEFWKKITSVNISK